MSNRGHFRRSLSFLFSRQGLATLFSADNVRSFVRRSTAPLYTLNFYKRSSVNTVKFSIEATKFFCLFRLISDHTAEARQSAGPSMLPTLADGGEWNLNVHLPFYRLLSSLWNDPTQIGQSFIKKDRSKAIGLSVGDLVVYVSPNDPRKEVCKRIIGLPGDTVLVDPRIMPMSSHEEEWGSRSVMRSQKEVKKPISDSAPIYIVVPKGHIWTSGDNLPNSIDSRHYGPVPLGLVKGKLMAKLWPGFSRSWLENPIEAA